jgi:hypothetical protein
VRRLGLVAAAALLVASGCGSAERSAPASSGSGRTLEKILQRPGADVALTPGTSDYAPGRVRFSFLIIRSNGKAVERPRARVWVGRSLQSAPLLRTEARLESIGVPGVSEAASGGSRIYVTRFALDRPGTYWVVVEPIGGQKTQAFRDLAVKPTTKAPQIGSKAIPSHTPTIRSEGGNLAALTTRRPPDLSLLRYSVAESLEAGAPFVVAFATPAFCESRTCGPIVDVVEAVGRRFARTGVRFIHVEVYEDNNPASGTNRWVKEWRLPTEPWIFLVGRDGRIKERFEGAVSVSELAQAVQRLLVR